MIVGQIKPNLIDSLRRNWMMHYSMCSSTWGDNKRLEAWNQNAQMIGNHTNVMAPAIVRNWTRRKELMHWGKMDVISARIMQIRFVKMEDSNDGTNTRIRKVVKVVSKLMGSQVAFVPGTTSTTCSRGVLLQMYGWILDATKFTPKLRIRTKGMEYIL